MGGEDKGEGGIILSDQSSNHFLTTDCWILRIDPVPCAVRLEPLTLYALRYAFFCNGQLTTDN